MVMTRIFIVGCNYRVLAKRMQIAVHSHRPRIRLLRTPCTVGRIARSAAILHRQTFTSPHSLNHFYHPVHHTSSLRQSLSQQCSVRQSLIKQCFPRYEPAPVRYAECKVRLGASARESVENWHLASPLSIEQPVYDVGFVEAMKAANGLSNGEADGWGAMAQPIVAYIWLLCSHCSLFSNTA
jgi:hypothetical protein